MKIKVTVVKTTYPMAANELYSLLNQYGYRAKELDDYGEQQEIETNHRHVVEDMTNIATVMTNLFVQEYKIEVKE